MLFSLLSYRNVLVVRVTGAEGPGEAHGGVDSIFRQPLQLSILAPVLFQGVFIHQVLILGSREGQRVRTRNPSGHDFGGACVPLATPRH